MVMLISPQQSELTYRVNGDANQSSTVRYEIGEAVKFTITDRDSISD